jgi:hypothetical protein
MSRITMLAESVAGEAPIPGPYLAVFSLCPHMAEGKIELSGESLLQSLIPFMTFSPS